MAIQEQTRGDTYGDVPQNYLWDWARRTGKLSNLANYYVGPQASPALGGSYVPLSTATYLKGRVPAGKSVLKYDLAGTMRRTDGMGAAGAYESL